MESTFTWKPEPTVLEKLTTLARQRNQSPESIIAEAVIQYIETQSYPPTQFDSDPLVGLFAGSPDLATNSEDILQQEITEQSGWTWKQPQS
ncbi:MAG: CopG family ribbon-helix-helix protein [Actinomycetota bacterium]